MNWVVLFDEEFAEWLGTLDEGLQDEILAHVELLGRFGPNLGRPRVDTVKGSKFPNMKELRIQYQGDPWRILFAFDPRRAAILLIGGNKRGDRRWYRKNIRLADRRFERHLGNPEEGGEEAMAIDARESIARLPEERREEIRKKAEALIAEELTLRQLREARRRSQVELAKILGINQAAVSKLERRADMYLSTLRKLIEAMGGSLEIVARFPDRPPVKISTVCLDIAPAPEGIGKKGD